MPSRDPREHEQAFFMLKGDLAVLEHDSLEHERDLALPEHEIAAANDGLGV